MSVVVRVMRKRIKLRFKEESFPSASTSFQSFHVIMSLLVDVSTHEISVVPDSYSFVTDTRPEPERLRGTAFVRRTPVNG